MVGCNGYRNPALYAKIASTVDVASHGRLYAGIGAGWYEHEWKAYGYEWPELPDRMGAFREAAETHLQDVDRGRARSSTASTTPSTSRINEPKGARKPHPSFWIGGGGEKVTLKLVAKYGDAGQHRRRRPRGCSSSKAAVLKAHCDKLGRDYDSIIKSTSLNVFPIEAGADPEKATAKARGRQSFEQFADANVVGTADEIAAKVEALVEAGSDYLITYIPGVAYDHEPLHRFASEVIPRFS